MKGYAIAFVAAFAMACAPMAMVIDGGEHDAAPQDVSAVSDTATDTPTDAVTDTPDDTAEDAPADAPTPDVTPDDVTMDTPDDVHADTRVCIASSIGCSASEQCCTGSCRAYSTVPTAPMYCCHEVGGECANRFDCCGSMACRSGTCVCVVSGGFCTANADCCSGVCAGITAGTSGICS